MVHKSKKSSISIVIPTKDRVEELSQTLRSIYKQKVLPNEIIIIDDCSLNPILAKDLPPPPKEIKLIISRNDPNKGGALSISKGIEMASSNFIATLDSDDCYLPGAIESIMSFWETDQDNTPACAIGHFWCTHELTPYKKQIRNSKVTLNDLLTMGNIIGGSSVMSIRKDSYEKVNGYPKMRVGYDYGFWIKLSRLGDIAIIPKPLMLYRSPSTNLLPTYTKNYRKQILSLFSLYRSLGTSEKKIMYPYYIELLFIELYKANRKRYALGLLKKYVFTQKKIKKSHIKGIIAMILGMQSYDRLLYTFAHLRAKARGRDYLHMANVNEAYIKELIQK